MKTILENDQKRDRFSMFSVNGNDDFEDFNVFIAKAISGRSYYSILEFSKWT